MFSSEGAKIDWVRPANGFCGVSLMSFQHSAMQAALSTIFLRPDLVVACDLALSRPMNSHDMQDEM